MPLGSLFYLRNSSVWPNVLELSCYRRIMKSVVEFSLMIKSGSRRLSQLNLRRVVYFYLIEKYKGTLQYRKGQLFSNLNFQ